MDALHEGVKWGYFPGSPRARLFRMWLKNKGLDGEFE